VVRAVTDRRFHEGLVGLVAMVWAVVGAFLGAITVSLTTPEYFVLCLV
jgi:hypothetical protein